MNGASVAKADFDDLYDVIGDRFGNVDSDHFNLPDTHHRFLEGTTNIAEVGNYISAGLPNIPVGNVPVISWNQGGPHYPFKLISRYSDFVQTTSAQTYWQNTQIGLDLASANAVYGGADTVQTASIRGSMLIRFE